MATRTDIHRPAVLVTEDYRYEGAFDLGGIDTAAHYGAYCEDATRPRLPEGATIRDASEACYAAMTRLWWSGCYSINEEGFDRCDHCGARIRYGAMLHHIPTDSHIVVGETCLDNRFERATEDFHRMRKAAQLDREQARIREAWGKFRAERPSVPWDALAESTNPFIVDVLSKGRRYGNLSERQVEAIVRAHEKATNPRVEAPRGEAQVGSAVTITGTVRSMKLQPSHYGCTWKMLVVATDAQGREAFYWGSVPRSLQSLCGNYRGQRVTLVANVERSADDPSFAFYKRPRDARIVGREPGA